MVVALPSLWIIWRVIPEATGRDLTDLAAAH
jgi:hypothetical protein